MRIGVQPETLDSNIFIEQAKQADELGIWAILLERQAGCEAIAAAQIAATTDFLRLVVKFDLGAEHALGIAEELAVLDNLSNGRVVAVVTGDFEAQKLDQLRTILIGHCVNNAILAPPCVQTQLPIWSARTQDANLVPTLATSSDNLIIETGQPVPGYAQLTGQLDRDRTTVDQWRDAGCTHLIVSWPEDIFVLSRHLVTRAATAEFPSIVAEFADEIGKP